MRCLEDMKTDFSNITLLLVLFYLKSQFFCIDDVHFVSISTPDELVVNNTSASNRILWLAKSYQIVSGQIPTAICTQHIMLNI